MAASNRTPRNETPVTPSRRVPATTTSTKAPQHRLPVNNAGPLTLTAHSATPAVTGPGGWENGRQPVETPGPRPPLAGATAQDVHPAGQDCTAC